MANAENKTKNRLTIITILAVFTLPVIFAWSAYFTGWFQQRGTSNKGELIQPLIEFNKLEPALGNDPIQFVTGNHWRIIQPVSDLSCLDSEEASGCLLSVYIMGQAHQALGKEQHRVKRQLFVGDLAISDEKIQELQERFVDLEIATGKSFSGTRLSMDYIYIADPLGNIMLRYPRITDKEGAFLKGKEILKDLKKMLKISRIG